MKADIAKPNLKFMENYWCNWKNHAIRMSRWRIPFQILHYQPNGRRSLGRPFKRWHETL